MFLQKLQKTVLIVFIVAVAVSIFLYQFFGEGFSLSEIRQYSSGFEVWLPVIFITTYSLVVIFLPSTYFMALSGILFGLKFGFIYALIGNMISAIIIFFLSRKLGREYVDKILEHKYLNVLKKYNNRLESGGIWDLIVLRIIPIMPFNVLSILMGVSRIKTENYIIGTIVGLIPSCIAAVYLGDIILKVFS